MHTYPNSGSFTGTCRNYTLDLFNVTVNMLYLILMFPLLFKLLKLMIDSLKYHFTYHQYTLKLNTDSLILKVLLTVSKSEVLCHCNSAYVIGLMIQARETRNWENRKNFKSQKSFSKIKYFF